MSLNLWWYMHEHPVWALVHLVTVGVLIPRAVATVINALARARRSS